MENEIDTSLVTVGQPVDGGCCYTRFDDDYTLPTDAVAPLGEGWESTGELSENGYTESESISSTDHKGWHGTTVLTTIDEEKNTYKAEFLEVSRPTAAKLRYGAANVEVDENGVLKHIKKMSNARKPVPLIFDELESNGYKRRTVVRRAMVNSIDDTPHKKGNLMIYGMTFTALDDGANGPYDIYRAKPASAYPEGTPSESWTVPQIEAYAKANNIDLSGCSTKAEKLAAVTASE